MLPQLLKPLLLGLLLALLALLLQLLEAQGLPGLLLLLRLLLLLLLKRAEPLTLSLHLLGSILRPGGGTGGLSLGLLC